MNWWPYIAKMRGHNIICAPAVASIASFADLWRNERSLSGSILQGQICIYVTYANMHQHHKDAKHMIESLHCLTCWRYLRGTLTLSVLHIFPIIIILAIMETLKYSTCCRKNLDSALWAKNIHPRNKCAPRAKIKDPLWAMWGFSTQ